MLRLSFLPFALFVLLGIVACDKPDEDDPVFVLGTLRTALTSEAGTLQIVALGGNRRSSTVDVAADGSFVLPVVRNRAYTLNVLDSASQTFLGSFLYRAGQNVSLSLSLGSEDLDLGFCQLQNGEVFCENGFFDSPIESGAITPATDSLGAVRGTIEATDADRVVLERLLGSLTFDLEIQPHPTEPFHIALFNKTYAGCDAPFLGTGEANGDERYFYSQVEYSNATCQATVRFQTNCTMKSAVCDGYVRIDILSSGSDCTEFPALHVAHPVRFDVLDPTAKTCALPPRCETNEGCASGHCDFDSGFCHAATERPRPLRIFAMDVGQGDATLIVTPKGAAILVDGGRTASGRLLAGLVKRVAGRLDYVIATHFDGDHVSGLSPIARGLDGAAGKKFVDDNRNGTVDEDAEVGAAGSDDLLPRVALDRGIDAPSANLDAWLKTFGTVRRQARAGEVLELPDEDVKITVVISNGQVMAGPSFPTPDENDKSVGLLIEHGDFRYLTLGDLPGGASGTRPMEQAVAEAIRADLPLDVLHLSHHGSGASSQPDFLAATGPTVATISVGDSETCGANFNTYGLPTQGVLDGLVAQASLQAVYQTETGGASFSGACAPDANQSVPRNYGRLKREVTYGTLTVEAWPTSYRVSGLTFDDFYSTHPRMDEAPAPAAP
ncbi:MAG: ComEC/Rec2 family competence protein [Bradymonadia bacterium]